MARKNRNLIKNGNFSAKWKVGIYCRLSSDDGDNAESDSIRNQKELISFYLRKEDDIEIVDYYIDDGYSGTSFSRPDFKRMMKDVFDEKINTIIVKDLSRFGRNYIETGIYIEEMFPTYNVRFIAINDNIDSYKDPKSINNVIVPFKNLMNDEYAKDISNKVKSVYRTKALKGEFVGGTTPYGYKKSIENKYKLVIDESEAVNVRLMFKMYLDGEGILRICRYLNDNKILCRKEVQRRQKRNLSLNSEADEILYKWSKSTIGKILTNETYIGNVVQNRTTTVSYRNHSIVYKPKEEWIVVKNTHEPIISENDFKKVQEMFKIKNCDKKKPSMPSIYGWKIKCADCGKAMCRIEDTRGKNMYSHFYCRQYKTVSSECSPHKISTTELNELVLKTILMQVKLVLNVDKIFEKIKDSEETKKIEQGYKYKANKLNNEIEKYKRLKKVSYEDWKLGKITKETYQEYAEDYDKRIENANNEIKVITEIYNQSIQNLKSDDYWIEHYRRNKKVKELSRDIIEELVDTIFVHEGGNITIRFKYEDEYKKALDFINCKEVKDNE